MEITCFALLRSKGGEWGWLFDVLIRRVLGTECWWDRGLGYEFQVAANNCDVSELQKALGRQMTPECEMPLQLSGFRVGVGSE